MNNFLRPIAILALMISFFNTVSAGVHFTDWGFDESKFQAKVRKKPLFLYIGSKTCLQSQKELETFNTSKLSVELNKNFVCTNFNIESIKGRIKAEKWGVSHYPTILVFDIEGKIIAKEEGYKTYSQVMEIVKKVELDNAFTIQKHNKSHKKEVSSDEDIFDNAEAGEAHNTQN